MARFAEDRDRACTLSARHGLGQCMAVSCHGAYRELGWCIPAPSPAPAEHSSRTLYTIAAVYEFLDE
jgi:hypothetical protein